VIELSSKRAQASIEEEAGGRLMSLVIDGHDVIGAVPAHAVTQEMRRSSMSEHDWYRGSFPLAPWAGALRGGKFTFDGVTHYVEKDASGASQHGVVAERPWAVEGNPSNNTAILSIEFGPEHPGRWPYSGRAVQSFVLTNSELAMRLEVHSFGHRMPAIAGFHPWFRYQLDDGTTASVTFAPTLRLAEVGGDLIATDDLGPRPWDEAFTDLTEPPAISWIGGPSLTLESDAPVWVYYEKLPGAFCIEPWTGPFNGIETQWANVVTPGNPLVLNFTIRFG
jgi:aldose 1-epimerase